MAPIVVPTDAPDSVTLEAHSPGILEARIRQEKNQITEAMFSLVVTRQTLRVS
jgi:hypothetical protein